MNDVLEMHNESIGGVPADIEGCEDDGSVGLGSMG